MSLLTSPLPANVEIGGQLWPINSGFKTSVQFELLTLSDQLTPEDILTLYYGDTWPQPYDEAIQRAIWFYRCGKEPEQKGKPGKELQSSRRSYDFEVDADVLYTSFRQAYGIDLLKEEPHWWAFRELMLGLPDETPFKQRVYYRVGSTEGMSRRQKKQFETRRKKYALPERGRVDHRLSLMERDEAMKQYAAQRFREINEQKRKGT